MTPEAQRIAIAEACGWTNFYTEANEFRGTPPGAWAYSNRTVYQDGSAPVPDYLNDLNAMHEAEKGLFGENQDGGQSDLFFRHLAHVVRHARIDDSQAWQHIFLATARQRAEAFLRTIGKWTDTKGE